MPKLYHQNGTWIVPGSQDRTAVRHDIPAVPAELAAWLNERETPASVPLPPQPAETTAPTAQPPSSPATLTLDTIAAWTLDTATAAEIEQLFAMIGTRFHELRTRAHI